MHYVLVAGESDTSRENVEAILEDYFYANKGEEIIMVVPFYKTPSRGQVYAMQMAKDNKADVLVYAPESARLENVEKSSLEVTDSPIRDSVSLLAGNPAVAYLLCSDDGQEFYEALQACREGSIPSYDLTAGGIPLTDFKPPIQDPKPKEPQTPKPSRPNAVQEALDGLVEAIRESILNGSK